jgi:Kdo2-lipid IVA 3' secondary acyltransferase
MMINRLLPFFTTLLARTLRISWRGDALPERAIIMFWHGDMLTGWYSVRKRRPVALVSQSKDGNFLAAVLKKWGYRTARGSSKKNGMEALELAMQSVKNGERNSLVITPDGPRGPRHVYKRGAFIAARELDLPLFQLHLDYTSRKTLKSWDQFEVPMPFSKVTIRAEQVDANR